MKTNRRKQEGAKFRKAAPKVRRWAPVALLTLSGLSLSAAETNGVEKAEAPPALTPQEMFEGGPVAYTNWVEFSTGGYFTSGNGARLQQRQMRPNGAFGGIEDFHYQADVATNTVLTLDGRGLFDNNDYKLKLDLKRENVGYVRFSYDEYRTWSTPTGGFDAASGMWYSRPGDPLALDRGKLLFEAGLGVEGWPGVTFKYRRDTREGEKSSTLWGIAHPLGVTRGLSPTFYDIDERRDSFELDFTHTIDRTDFGAGVRIETGKLDDALKITQSPNEIPNERKITDRQGTKFDALSFHGFTETWLTNNLMFSTGFAYSDVDSDFSASRIYGSDFDVGYTPNGLNGFGYTALNGTSRLKDYVADLNLFYKPTPNLAIIPSLRVQKEDIDVRDAGTETLGIQSPTGFTSLSERRLIDVRERIDIRYTGITNWVLFARTDFTQGEGNLNENGGLGPVGGIGIAPINRATEDQRFFQKYSAGARWYPTRKVTVDGGGYYKLNRYDYDHTIDRTVNNGVDRYPAYLVMQDFETYDGNVRLTLRPVTSVTLVSGYEFEYSTIHTKPDSLSGLRSVETSEMTSHIFAQDVSWAPWTRLYLQAGFNYVVSEAKTPASDVTQAILNAQNNYWTLNFSSSLVVDDKTDLKIAYFYYRADNFTDNSAVTVNYGSGAEEHGVTATVTRQIRQNLRLTLRYGFYASRDELAGDNLDYDAHVLYSGLQYRF